MNQRTRPADPIDLPKPSQHHPMSGEPIWDEHAMREAVADHSGQAAAWLAVSDILLTRVPNLMRGDTGHERAVTAMHRLVKWANYQARVGDWLPRCFSQEVARDELERCFRFFEESTELVQSKGMTRTQAHELVDYTFNREKGEPRQEVGGAMVTLAALCHAADIDMREAAEEELTRINQPDVIEKIRVKQASKPHQSPLPGKAGREQDPLDEFKRVMYAYEEALGEDDEDMVAPARQALLDYMRPIIKSMQPVKEIRPSIADQLGEVS